MIDFRIAAALINCFHMKYISDKEDGKEIAHLMKKKLNLNNDLKSYLIIKQFHKKFMVPIDAFEIFDFPKLTIDEIGRHVTIGISNKPNLAEHFKINGKYVMKMHFLI